MRLAPLALTLAVSLGLASSASAQDQLETLSGQIFEGKVISDDGTSVEFQTDQGMTMKLPHENLTVTTRYMLRRSKVASDEKSQLQLAEWCVTQKLYQEARRHYQLALAADPTQEQEINASITKARATASVELLDRAKKLMDENRPEDARQVLIAIVQELPLEPAAKEASTLLATDNERLKAAALARSTPPGADASEAAGGSAPADGSAPMDGGAPANTGAPRQTRNDFSAEAQKLFAPVVKLYDSILDNTQKGLQETNQSRSISAYESALKDADRARKEVEKLRPKGPTDEEVAEALTLVDSKIESASVDCRTQLANAYMLRSSYNQASDVVKAGLAVYPQNAQLNQLMNSVVSANSSDSWGGGYGILRRGGVPTPNH